MSTQVPVRVADPPSKPVMIWDGECLFCRRWIERWRELTRGEVDYVASQEIGNRFPEISRAQFEQSVVLIEPNGKVLAGAEAVMRSLRHRPAGGWLSWTFERVPIFAAISQAAYQFIARHRRLASFVTRCLWGNQVLRPTFFRARCWFLRAIGLIYLVAFISLWVQVDGLIGRDGILPVGNYLADVHQQIGSRAISLLPTLCWLNASNGFLHFLCAAGAGLSIVLILGIAPAVSLGGLFVCYLSLTMAGQTFLSFQWDILLLETGFLSIFLAPWRLWPNELMPWRGSSELSKAAPVSGIALFLLKLLLFKLMFMSGVVKLTSGDDSWWNLTALDYHYWTQPLPTVFAWWANQSPEWFRKASVAICLFIEIIVPFFIWAPRRPRLLAASLLIFLQIVIAITGNYCFFNLLTIALCLLLIDDSTWRRRRTAGDQRTRPAACQTSLAYCLSFVAAIIVLLVTLPLNAWHIYNGLEPDADMPLSVRSLFEKLEPFRIVNGYGLFRVMTKDRKEIVIEGSRNGIDWQPYEFKWKPGDIMRPPGWCAPHQPRLDWQMWFAALGNPRDRLWFANLMVRLLENKPEVKKLFAVDPFPETGPHYLRAEFYRYRFTSAAERRESGAWWKRQELGEYFPTVSVDQLR